jgi:hypothetical protein
MPCPAHRRKSVSEPEALEEENGPRTEMRRAVMNPNSPRIDEKTSMTRTCGSREVSNMDLTQA